MKFIQGITRPIYLLELVSSNITVHNYGLQEYFIFE